MKIHWCAVYEQAFFITKTRGAKKMTEKRMYDLKEAMKIIPLSRAGLYKACSEGTIPAIKIGARVFIPSWYIDKITAEPAH